MYSPAQGVILPMLSTIGAWSCVPQVTLTTPPTSATYELANRAVYVPVLVPVTCVAKRLWWANGSTVSASYNVDVGVYLDASFKPGTKLVSTGSTAQGTASEVQFVDVTDTTLAPGRYWLALSCSSTSATFFRHQIGVAYEALFRFEEASALPLPATATPVESTSANVWVFGFATTSSP